MEKLQIYFDCPGIPKMYMCFKHGSSIFFISDYAAGGPFDKFLRFNCKIYLIRLEEERTKMRVYVLVITNEKNILIFLSLSLISFLFSKTWIHF